MPQAGVWGSGAWVEGALKELVSCHGRQWAGNVQVREDPTSRGLLGSLPGAAPHRGRLRTLTSVHLCWQVFEDKQRLWLDELEDLKQMYMARLQQVTQQAQRGQRALQLQLYKAQQEKKRLQEELSMQQCQCEEPKLRQPQGERVSPKLEETKWEVSPLPSLPVATLLAVEPGWGQQFPALMSLVATGQGGTSQV